MEHLFDQPLQVGEPEMEKFLGHNTHIMKAYYDAFNTDDAEAADMKIGWEGMYASLKVQIQRLAYGSIDPKLTEEQRADARRKGHLVITDLCNVAIFFKNKIPKADLLEIRNILYHMRFIHPIGEAIVETDLAFKDYVVRTIVAIGDYVK
jgi:hypothetical protein